MYQTIKLFVTALFLLFSMTMNAQLGIRAGANLARVTTDDDAVNLTSIGGYHAGIVYEIDLGDNILIRPGALFTTKGGISEFNEENITTRTNYIEIPVDLHVKFGQPGGTRFGIYAGPYIGVLLSAQYDGEEAKDSFKNGDLGANVGLTLDLSILTFGMNYGAGLVNVAEEDLRNSAEVKNQTLSAFAMLRF